MNITRTGVLLKTRDQLGIQPNDNLSPINLVYPIHHKYSFVCKNGSKATTGSTTVYTTPSDREFYLTSIIFSLVKDAVCDAATGQIGVTLVVDGANQYFCPVSLITLTAQQYVVNLSLPFPLKIDKNTAIATNLTYAAGVCSRALTITGFIIE